MARVKKRIRNPLTIHARKRKAGPMKEKQDAFIRLAKIAEEADSQVDRYVYGKGQPPPNLEGWAQEWECVKQCFQLVGEFFRDKKKTKLWFETPNPLLGHVPPIEMINIGRAKKLLSFIKNQLDGNHP